MRVVILALALQAVVFGSATAPTPPPPPPATQLDCSDEFGTKFAGLMMWVQNVCVTQLGEQPPADSGSGLGSCENPECARVVARVADGCRSFFSDGFGEGMGKGFRQGFSDMCQQENTHDPAHEPPPPPMYAIADHEARGGRLGHEIPIKTCAGSLTDGFDRVAPDSMGQYYAVVQPPPGQKVRLTVTEMYLPEGNLRLGHGTAAAATGDWNDPPMMGTNGDAVGSGYVGDVGEPVRALFVEDADKAASANSFNLAITCECVEPNSCGVHGECRSGVCECSGGYQLLNGTCDDATCVGIDCGGEEHGQCYKGACLCRPGWIDHSCGTPDPCAPIECQNGGTCEAQGSDATCRCAQGFLGDRCEERDPCAGVWCSSHGECVGGTCQCTDGYSGDSCMDDCGALARKNKGIVRTNSNHVAATGCTEGYDTCLFETCDDTVKGCTLERNGVDGLPFTCLVNGIGAECKWPVYCVRELIPRRFFWFFSHYCATMLVRRLLCASIIPMQLNVSARPAWGALWWARDRDRWRNARVYVHWWMERHLLHGTAGGALTWLRRICKSQTDYGVLVVQKHGCPFVSSTWRRIVTLLSVAALLLLDIALLLRARCPPGLTRDPRYSEASRRSWCYTPSRSPPWRAHPPAPEN